MLNDFKDREMFRIDMRHILGHTKEFWDFSDELTDLVEVVVNAAYHLCHKDLRTLYGTPLLENGELSDMAVCALGKCGGRELGFASDIELMFIYAGNGRTAGPEVIATSEFYEKLVQTFVSAIRATRGWTDGLAEVIDFLVSTEHIPHYNPVPTGWPEDGDSWINTNNMLDRQNFGFTWSRSSRRNRTASPGISVCSKPRWRCWLR